MNRLASLLPILLAAVLLYVPLSGWKLLYGGAEGDDPRTRSYGAGHHVPGFHWVVALNPQGVANAGTRIAFFEQCLIRYRGRVDEVTSHFSFYTSLSGDVLVEYANPAGSPSAGILCPDETVFLVPGEELTEFNDRFQARREYEHRLAEEVEGALAAGRRGGTFQWEENFRWVEVVNPSGVRNFGYTVPFLDTCGIEAGGTVQEVRQISLGPLYEYTPHPERGFRGIGIPCPARTVFFLGESPSRYF